MFASENTLGADFPLFSLVIDPLLFQAISDPHRSAMLRIVDVKLAMESRPIIDNTITGHIVLQIIDSVADWNNGFWILKLELGYVRCISTNTLKDPDAIVDIAVLAQLFAGFISVINAIQTGLIQVLRESAIPLLQTLFQCQKPPFSGDNF